DAAERLPPRRAARLPVPASVLVRLADPPRSDRRRPRFRHRRGGRRRRHGHAALAVTLRGGARRGETCVCGHSTEGNSLISRIPLGGVTTNAGCWRDPRRPAVGRRTWISPTA